ncbi:MAG: sigma-54-dependent Fis family transcriptional regulator [Nitrospirae bacterium]|nr:sigma-54-dependent Fis family transcriptional regulator [Nitrospirota bacterium]
MSTRALVAVSDPTLRSLLIGSLKAEEVESDEAVDWNELMRNRGPYELYLADSQLQGADFQEVMKELQERETDGGVVIVTGPDETEKAVEAMRQGAADYIARPFRSDSEVGLRLRRALLQGRLRRDLEQLRQSVSQRFQFDGLLGKSKPMQELYKNVAKIAPTEANVLIVGESGTGKELLAKTVHFNSLRGSGKFVAVDCGALTETLLSSELFGHEKGAFTGAVRTRRGLIEEAQGGTIFLDEIGNTSLGFQIKLLRVLEERQIQRVGSSSSVMVDVRVLAATNQDLKAAVKEGTFREDLYYRLNVFELKLPPLRERPEDIPILAHHFLKQFSEKLSKSVTRFTESAMKRLLDHPWPGNVRELENAIERAVILCEKDELDETILPQTVTGKMSLSGFLEIFGLPWHEAQDRFEIEYFTRLLDRSGGNITQAAEAAGVPRQTVHYKVRKHNLKERK